VKRAPALRIDPRVMWCDRGGRFSLLKAACLACCLAPASVLFVQWWADDLGARPVKALLLAAGLWTVRFIVITLAISPARTILDWHRLVLVRRMLGVTAMAYGLGHLTLYIVMEKFQLGLVVSEIALRIYLTIGFITLVGLVTLGSISTDAAIRRLGRNWKRLQRLVYPIAALALLHYFMQSKLNVNGAVLMAGFVSWLLLWRLLPGHWQPKLIALFALAPLSALATAGIEAGWYAVATRIDPWRVLEANLQTMMLRPSAWVLIVALGVAVLAAIRRIRLPPLGTRVREPVRGQVRGPVGGPARAQSARPRSARPRSAGV
jgi:sulfoxide reductase heme-binding subunit YedZ